jgi:plastocyanin
MSYTYGVVYIYLWNYATSAWEYTGQIFYENEISTREGWISTDYISSSGEMKIRFALYATVPSSFGTIVIKIDSVGWAVIPKQSPDLPPIPIIDSPSDVAYIEGMGGQSITWSPSSDSPRDYTILKDGIEVQTSPWSGAAITYSIDGLTAGNYVFTCKVEDSFFQTTEDSVNVKVQAATNITLPAINNPADITYIAGVAGHSVTWLTSGSNPLTYKIYKDGVVVKSDTWIPGGITYSVDGLAEGTYVFKCEIIASGGALAYDEVVVTVQPPQENPVNENVLPILGVAALIGLGMIYFIRRK